jgi:hypothetical protein
MFLKQECGMEHSDAASKRRISSHGDRMSQTKHLNKQQLNDLAQRTSDQERPFVEEAAKALPEKESRNLLALIRGSESEAVHAAHISTSSTPF